MKVYSWTGYLTWDLWLFESDALPTAQRGPACDLRFSVDSLTQVGQVCLLNQLMSGRLLQQVSTNVLEELVYYPGVGVGVSII